MKILLALASLILFVLGLGLVNEFKPLDLADMLGCVMLYISAALIFAGET